MAGALHLAVRTVHVLGMVVLLAGSAAVWAGLRVGDRAAGPLLRQFECVFWAAMGVMVVTGVGNLGALGAPGPGTRWGAVFTLKLAVVALFVAGSGVRSLAVFRLRDVDDPDDAVCRRITSSYGATTGALLVVVVLAEVLAHG
ncbi:CopD family protein [Halobaculum sp. P14]|uniref:CopD family protein n=1 Tax=Halobaculum sp. P14 TaxID=3421638 RepID=UPI003EBBE476